jgi:MSHA pilin protein MshD
MSSSRQRGLSLVEVVIFIVVLGIGLAGMAIIYNQLTLASVDPVVRKQAVAIANSLMEEIQLRPFTYCDPDDPNVFTAPVPPCGTPEGLGPEVGGGVETRYNEPRFDNANDYDGFQMLGSIQDVSNVTIADLNGYSARVDIVNAGADFTPPVPADAALRITVTVTGPANVSVALQGYRLRYAPNSP